MATQKIEDKYKKYELREHIYNIPDTYIGSINPINLDLYLFDDPSKKMANQNINYVPGLLKIFDEVIVNAIDHSVRLIIEEGKGKKDVKHMRNIRVTIDKKSGVLSVYNDGNGIDVVMHETEKMYVPELVVGNLLTSTNYNHQEEKIIGGKGGYGMKLANIFSKQFEVETVDHYRQRIFTQKYRNNMLEKDKPSVKSSSKQPYTKITFLPDYERFGLKGISDDMYNLFRRRTIDAAACTNKNVSIYFNEEKLPIKDFEKYSELFIDKSESPLIYENCNERWEIAVGLSKNGIFEQISFVNGINTIRGGTHTNFITNTIIKKLSDMIESKKKKVIKPQILKDNLFVFIKSTIVNPAFDSQSKETLTTPVAKFGSKCDISDKFIEKLYKTNIVEKALSLTEFQNAKKLSKTDGKKTSRLIIPKLDDANLAGTKDSDKCTLILTEGDSAKTMAIAGLSIVGRDKYGVFPLRGKIMNVKDASLQKISDNAEITAIKKIIGLEQNKNYTNLATLRYGKIMILTDQDHDGSHIKGLLFNVFQSMWPSLYKIDGFLTSMLTPIIKASNSSAGKIISFYNMSDYESWLESADKKNSNGTWKIKYYKGLGTSSDGEAKEYFKEMKSVTYIHTNKSDEHIDLAFNKKRADDRKKWLMKYEKNDVLDYSKAEVKYEEFVNKDLIHFSNRDLERSINHICDGLKESTRKILFACIKRRLFTNEIKVAQLAGNVSEVTAYHHGEQSLQQAIIGMAQIFVGNNNINLLSPHGQFGCLDPNTDILMWDSSIKKAKDIVVGDKLVGDDGNIRNVLKTTQGVDTMYEILMVNGERYVVNSQHILTLKFKGNKSIWYKESSKAWKVDYYDSTINKVVSKSISTIETSQNSTYNKSTLSKEEAYQEILKYVNGLNTSNGNNDDIFDIKIDDFLKLSDSNQKRFYCVKNSQCINWDYQDIEIDPYVLGIWLGDENSDGNDVNPYKEILKKCDLFNNKHIPLNYIYNDRTTRLQLLAGIIDTDGSVKYNNGIPIIEIAQSTRLRFELIKSIQLLANSLGYRTSVSVSKTNKMTKKGEKISNTTLLISGHNIDEIPTRVERKKIKFLKERIINPYNFAFTINKLGEDKFCGWSVDGNERFLLGDFTITHNSRIVGGSDASSPRYIYTLVSELTRLIFREEDGYILNYLEEDGQSIEPEYYIPIIPMILVNGGVGIGTGFSTNIPQFNPEDIISICMKVCDGIANKDVGESLSFINNMKIGEFAPWYLGYTGKIAKSEKGSYVSTGVYNWIDDNTLEITELPVGTWTEDYKELLENMLTTNSNYLKSFENHYTSKNVKFILNFNGDVRGKLGNKFETEFKLVSSKNMSINNMHLYSNEGAIKKYDNTSDIVREWSKVRIQMYDKRKKYQIKILEKDFKVLSAKIRFIIDVIEGRIVIMNKKIADITQKLIELKYPKIGKDDEDETADDNGYNYLLKMPISQLTYDRKIILEKEVDELSKKLNDLRNTSLDKIWKNELQELLGAWKAHREFIELDYENDKKGIVTQKQKKKQVKTKVVKK